MCVFVQQISQLVIFEYSQVATATGTVQTNTLLKIPDVHDNPTKRRNTPNHSIQNKTGWFSSSVGIRRHLIYLASFYLVEMSAHYGRICPVFTLYPTVFLGNNLIHDQLKGTLLQKKLALANVWEINCTYIWGKFRG